MTEPLYSIGRTSELSGVPVETVRIWERRYSVVQPTRTEGGHRKYTARDIELLNTLMVLTEGGARIGKLSRLSRGEIMAAAFPTEIGHTHDDLAQAVLNAARAYDGVHLKELLRRPLASSHIIDVARELYLPLLATVGELWHAGKLSVAAEHLVEKEITHRRWRAPRPPHGQRWAARRRCMSRRRSTRSRPLGRRAHDARARHARGLPRSRLTGPRPRKGHRADRSPAFVNGLKAADRFAGRAQVTRWMYRITYNTALMSLRSKRRKPTESLDALSERGGVEVAHGHENLARGMTLRKVQEALGDALSQLSTVDRKIASLRLYQGWSTQAVAKELGLSPSATKTRLHRARAQLKDLLDDDLLESANAVAA